MTIHQIRYRQFDIMVDYTQAQPYSICFNQIECDYGDFDSLPQAKKAVDRFWTMYGPE